MLYLDTAATTPLHPSVLAVMTNVLRDAFGNPSSLHEIGLEAENLLKQSRQRLASGVGCKPAQLFFTSGATEANNWAVESAWLARNKRGKTLLAAETAHASVLEKMESMKARGAKVVLLPVKGSGALDLQVLDSVLSEEVIFISLLWVNNETGVIEPFSSLLSRIRKTSPHALVHVDGVQGFLKLPMEPGIREVDFFSVSAHKIYGPKGVGALAVRENLPLHPLIYGGGQEAQKRGGTENVAGICGFGEAVDILRREREINHEKMNRIRTEFENFILSRLDDARVNGAEETRAPHISSLSIQGVRGEVMVHALAALGVFVSTGAACSSKKASVSHVLQAMKVPPHFLAGSIRASFSPDHSLEEVLFAAQKIVDTARELRKNR